MSRDRLRQWMLFGVASAGACAAAPPRPAPAASLPAPAPQAPDESFRRSAPQPDQASADLYAAPVFHQSTLTNGMGLIIVERHTMNIVAAELVVRGGDIAFPAEPPALFELMTEASFRGTRAYTENELFDRMNAGFFELRASVGSGWLSYRFRTLKRTQDLALQALGELVLRPTFPAQDVDMDRRRLLAQATREGDDVPLVARRSLYASVFGPSHPYARANRSGAPGLAKLTREDVVRAWKEALDPAQAVLIVVGGVEDQTVRARAEEVFGAWTHDPSQPARTPVPSPQPTAARVVVIDRPGAPRVHVLCGSATAAIDSPRRPADLIVHDLLGGMRSSGVETRLRDELGATWGVKNQYVQLRAASLSSWEWNAPLESAPRTLAAFERRVRELSERGPSPDELAQAKSYIIHSLPHRLETLQGTVAEIAELAAYQLPLDDLSTMGARIDALTADDVRAAVPPPAAVKVVVVGDLVALRGPLLALGWGPIEVRDTDGALIRTIAP
jgi:zinc protease